MDWLIVIGLFVLIAVSWALFMGHAHALDDGAHPPGWFLAPQPGDRPPEKKIDPEKSAEKSDEKSSHPRTVTKEIIQKQVVEKVIVHHHHVHHRANHLLHNHRMHHRCNHFLIFKWC